jgi:hypothetical protein
VRAMDAADIVDQSIESSSLYEHLGRRLMLLRFLASRIASFH